jgi:hypothetical protein
VKTRLFPDLPLVVAEWTDAYYNFDEQVCMDDVDAAGKFGSPKRSEDAGFLVRIDSKGVVMAHTRWTESREAGHSNALPLEMVISVKGVDGTVYYERKKRAVRRKVQVEG